MLPDMSCNNFSVLWLGVVENPLDQVVAVLIAGNIDQRNAGAVTTTFANPVEIASKEVSTANLQTLLHYFRSELISAVFSSIADNMINGSTAIGRATMLTDVLNAPVSELAMGHNVDIGKDFFDAESL